jgi:hypothetical protein
MAEYIKKDELLERIRKDRAAFAALWSGLSDAQMTQRPGVQDDWSVKDLIAHIVWWENLMLENVVAVKNSSDYHMIYDIDAQNTEVFAAHQDDNLADVLAAFESNLAKLEEHIGALSDEQINNTRLPKYPLLDHIIGDTYGHYKAHWADLERYSKQVKNS